jgi:hypothetical protein
MSTGKQPYRVLNKEELEGLSNEFIQFLVLNGIPADEWVKIKEEHPDRAEEIISFFSETIFEQIFRKAQFLRKISTHEIICYQCLAVRMVLVGVRVDKGSDIDFRKDDFQEILQKHKEGNLDLKIFHGKDKYTIKREHQLFQMTTQGFSISDGSFFKALSLGL